MDEKPACAFCCCCDSFIFKAGLGKVHGEGVPHPLPEMAATAGIGPGRSREPRASSGSFIWVAGAQALGPSLAAFLGH